MTTIALHSDLHLDFQKLPEGWLDKAPDILILAGDILRIDKVADFLLSLSRSCPHMEIIYTTGNHEYYDIPDMLGAEKALRDDISSHQKIHFLQCNSIELYGIRFIGCTGWSQMLDTQFTSQQEGMFAAEYFINDFKKIGFDGRNFSAQDCVNLGKSHYQWLEEELQKQSNQKTFVITHFAPSYEVANPKYPITALALYFYSGYEALIEEFQPTVWAFGHTHGNFDIKSGKTRIVSNQKGYGVECADSYDVHKVIKL